MRSAWPQSGGADMTAAAYEYCARKARARNRRINLFCAFMCAIGVASLVGQVWL
jgi:hypothetical protein